MVYGAERAGAIPCRLMAAFDEDEWFEQQAEKMRQQNLRVAPMASFDEDAWFEQQAEKIRQQNLSVASSKLIKPALLGANAAGSMRPEELGEHQGRAEKRSCTMFEHSPELAAYGGASKLKRSAVHRTELPHALHSGGSLIAEIGVLQGPPGINSQKVLEVVAWYMSTYKDTRENFGQAKLILKRGSPLAPIAPCAASAGSNAPGRVRVHIAPRVGWLRNAMPAHICKSTLSSAPLQ